MSSIKTSIPFELVHLDLWGPYRVSTYEGCITFLTIVDDFTRMTWVFFLKCKSDAYSVFTDFVKFVETQFGTVIKHVRSDNGLELCEGNMKILYKEKGIDHQTSCRQTAQQNGVVER